MSPDSHGHSLSGFTGYLIDLDTGELALHLLRDLCYGHIRHLFRLDGLHGAGYRPLDLCSVPDYYHFIELLRVFPQLYLDMILSCADHNVLAVIADKRYLQGFTIR